MKRELLFLALAMAVALPLFGQEEDKELAELLAVIESETAIATKTRMNSDYVPGIVTVLESEELEALGFETVWEALAMVPGVQPVRDGAATPSLIVRGIQFPFNNGNVKILIDGVPLTREAAGINSTALNLPIEAIERIEVIRGPGSVIYGDFAFMGIVNIVTKREGSRAHLRVEDDVYDGLLRLAGGKEWQVAGTVASLQSDNARVQTGRRAEEERHLGLLTLRHGNFGLTGQFLQRDIGDTTPAPRPPGPAIAADESTWAVQARYGRTLMGDLQATATATLLDTRMSSGMADYDDRVKRFAVDLQWDRFKRQSWLAGAEFSNLRIQTATHRPPDGAATYTITGGNREVKSLTLQDRIDLSDSFTVTAGVRFDDYHDIGSRTTPRLSVVWRASDNHIVKAQYAEGFRAPTFFEEFGGGRQNLNLDFEVNATTEVNYVYRRPRMVARATVFHSDLKDMVFGGLPGGRFGNTRKAQAEGVEVEWSQQVSEAVKVVANVAFVDTEDNRGPTTAVHESESAADWMSDLAVLIRPIEKTIVSLHWNHVGDRQVPVNGDAYNDVALTFTRQDLFREGLSVRAGIKNALDSEIRYIGVRPTGDIDANVYEGRVWWVGVGFRP